MSSWEGAELSWHCRAEAEEREASAGKGEPGRDNGLGRLPGEAKRLADPSLLVGNLSYLVSWKSLFSLDSFPVDFPNLEDSSCRHMNLISLCTMEGCAKGRPHPRFPGGEGLSFTCPTGWCSLACSGSTGAL